jgi:hypothetical protein
MPARKRTRGYIRISFALLLTVAAALWIVHPKVNRQGMDDPYNASRPNTMSNSQEFTKPHGKPVDQISSQKRKGSQRRFTDSKISVADSSIEEGDGPGSINDEVHISGSGESSDPAIFTSSEDGGFNQVPSMSDLVRSIENLEAAETFQMEQAIRDLWIVAADLGAPNEALDALEYFILEHNDADLIEMADSAIEDLLRVFEIGQDAPIITYASEDKENDSQIEDPCRISLAEFSDGLEGSENEEIFSIVQARMEDLGKRALTDPDASKRGDAIQALSNFRNDDAVGALIDTADDPEAMNRYRALQALWISAADGPLGKEDFIWHSLQQGQDDIDTQVADLATRALKDLEQLEQDLAEAEAIISFEQEHYFKDVPPAGQMHETDGRSDPSIND